MKQTHVLKFGPDTPHGVTVPSSPKPPSREEECIRRIVREELVRLRLDDRLEWLEDRVS